MASEFVIIDGYNLLHAAGMAKKRYGPGGLEKSRNGMLNFLASHIPEGQRQRVTIVFDASEAPTDLVRRSQHRGLNVVFAPVESDADSLIEEMLDVHSSPKQVRVVSSDHRIQRAAKRRRSDFVDSEDYFDELELRGPVEDSENGSRGSSSPKYGGDVSDAETKAWQEVFGDIPESDKLKSRDEGQTDLLDELQKEVDEWEAEGQE